EPDELLELTDRRERDEIEILPQLIQLAPLRSVEDQIVKRTIVAEVSHLAVKSGAQQPVTLRIRGNLAWVGQEHAAALRHVEPVREEGAKTAERVHVWRA